MTPYEAFAGLRLMVTLAFLAGHSGGMLAANADHRWACQVAKSKDLCEIARGALWGQIGLSSVQIFGAVLVGISLAVNGTHASHWAIAGGCLVLAMQGAVAATAIINTRTRNKVMGRR